MNAKKKLVIATRGSMLALWQANYVSSLLANKGYDCELNIIKTQGDRVQDRFLHEMGGKGLFVRELEQAMIDGKADLAVHSLKDLPAITPKPFVLPAMLTRHDHRDAIIFRKGSEASKKFKAKTVLGEREFKELGKLTIATSSLRRQSLFKGLSRDITLEPVRGNVDTRIRKLDEHGWDALVLAAASLERLELNDLHACFIDPSWYVPCAAQGALAIECHEDAACKDLIASLSDPRTYASASLERAILAALGGDCTMPFGSLVTREGDETHVRTVVLAYDGQEVRSHWTSKNTPEDLDQSASVQKTMDELKAEGLQKILDKLASETAELGELKS